MLFRWSNALVSFQYYIIQILAKKLDIFVIVYLDEILIYTEDLGQSHVAAVQWVLDVLRKHSLFTKLKKCRFYKDEVRFLEYIASSQGIWMEDERIKAVRNWLEPKLVRDIQVFISFANFYWRFIQGFSNIAAPLTSMLMMIKLSELASRLKANNNEVVGDGYKVDNRNSSKKSKKVKSGI